MRNMILLIGSVVAAPLIATAQDASVLSGAPKIATSSPSAWAVQVPSTQKQISISFDQPMIPGFTAWLGRSSLPPEADLGKSAVSDDRKTFSLDVTLQPAKVYVLALNEKGAPGAGFQNEKGLSAPRFYLVFQTAGTPPPDDAPPRAVSTSPASNAQQVNPAKVKSVVINFDKPMQTAKHGLLLTENKNAVDLSKARFQYSPDGKSFTLAYEFKSSSTYEVELNNSHNIGFASTKRVPLWPVRFAFTTGQPQ